VLVLVLVLAGVWVAGGGASCRSWDDGGDGGDGGDVFKLWLFNRLELGRRTLLVFLGLSNGGKFNFSAEQKTFSLFHTN